MKKIILSFLCLSASLHAFAQFDDVQTTTTTTTTTTTDDFGGVNMNVNMGGMGGVNVNVTPGTMGGTTTTQQTTTVRQTTTTSSSGYSGGYSTPPSPPAYNPPPPARPTNNNYGGYSGRVGCPNPMNDGEFSSVLGSISRNDFENTKLSMAKQIIGSRCVTSAQVRSVMQVFEFENSRLEFAKFAYRNTYDIDNYFMVNDAFEFESSKTDLMKSTH